MIKKVFFAFLFIVFAFLLGLLLYYFLPPRIRGARGTLEISSNPESKIFLNNSLAGTTPLTKKLKIGEYNLKLEAEIGQQTEQEKVEYESSITLNEGVQTIVNYDFSVSKRFSAGEILTLKEIGTDLTSSLGETIKIVADPEDASALIDEKQIGEAPLSTKIPAGEHKLKIQKEGYLARELTINKPEGFELTVKVKLALNPIVSSTQLEATENYTLFDLSLGDAADDLESKEWSKAVLYYQDQEIFGATKFDILLDPKGITYPKETKIEDFKDKKVTLGYLDIDDSGTLTDDAQKTYTQIKSLYKPPIQILINNTPTGFLNVRDNPSSSGTVVAKVNPGEKYPFLEEVGGWYKIQLTDKSGWISSQYASKV